MERLAQPETRALKVPKEYRVRMASVVLLVKLAPRENQFPDLKDHLELMAIEDQLD